MTGSMSGSISSMALRPPGRLTIKVSPSFPLLPVKVELKVYVQVLLSCLEKLPRADDLLLKGGAYMARGGALFWKGAFPETEETPTLAIEMNQKTDFITGLMGSFVQFGTTPF